MTDLLPIALQNRSLLQALYEGEHKTLAALSAGIGRDKSNVSKSLKALEAADLAWRPEDAFWSLTVEGIDTLGRLGRLDEQPAAPAAAVDGIAGLLHAQILTSLRNPRRDWDSEEAQEALAELAASIKAEGRILQNLVVRPADPVSAEHIHVHDAAGHRLPIYELVAGERRWRAVELLIKAGDWPAERALPALVADLDDAGHDRVALIENLKRRDLKPLEEARAFKRLVDGGMKTSELAETIRCTQRLVQQRLQLLELSEGEQARLERGEITIEGARTLLANRPEPIDIAPAQTLIILELALAIARKGDNFFTYTPIDYRTPRRLENGGDLAWLEPLTYVGGDYASGQTMLRFHYPARRWLAQLTGSETPNERALADPLRQARLAEAPAYDPRANPLSANYIGDFAWTMVDGLEESGRFMTDFLNPPFLIDPDELKEIADRKAAELERRQRQQQETAEREARERQRKAAGAQVRDLGLKFEDKVVATPERVTETLAAFGHPLPWSWTPETKWDAARLVDAAGEDVGLDYDSDDLLALVMAAVNAAGGHAPIVKAPEPDEDAEDAEDSAADPDEAKDRPEFVSWIADRIQQLLPHWKSERCRSKAGHALDEALKLEGREFGDRQGFVTWLRADAHDIANAYVADLDDGDGHPDDQDEAEAPDGDGEFEEA